MKNKISNTRKIRHFLYAVLVICGFCDLNAQTFTDEDFVTRIEKRNIKCVWESGFKFTEYCLDRNGTYIYDIDTGYYWNIHREVVKPDMFKHDIKLHDVALASYYIYCYLDNGELKSSRGFVLKGDNNKLLMLYIIELIAIDGKIRDVIVNDCRGYSLEECGRAIM